jgi:hypothetical protein
VKARRRLLAGNFVHFQHHNVVSLGWPKGRQAWLVSIEADKFLVILVVVPTYLNFADGQAIVVGPNLSQLSLSIRKRGGGPASMGRYVLNHFHSKVLGIVTRLWRIAWKKSAFFRGRRFSSTVGLASVTAG